MVGSYDRCVVATVGMSIGAYLEATSPLTSSIVLGVFYPFHCERDYGVRVHDCRQLLTLLKEARSSQGIHSLAIFVFCCLGGMILPLKTHPCY